MPEPLLSLFEDIYAQGISSSFLIVVPFAVLSCIAILFIPNIPLTHMTNEERRTLTEADLATIATAEAFEQISDAYGTSEPEKRSDDQ